MKGDTEVYRLGVEKGFLRCLPKQAQCLYYYGAPGAVEWMQARLSGLVAEYGIDSECLPQSVCVSVCFSGVGFGSEFTYPSAILASC
eukprot:COSAG06_NODE_3295_length_5545_cov_1.506427_4_plen_87_part_00